MAIEPHCDRVLYDALCAENPTGVELRDASDL